MGGWGRTGSWWQSYPLASSFSMQHFQWRTHDDLEVEPGTHVGNVLKIDLTHLIEAHPIARRHLPETGDAGQHLHPLFVPVAVQLILIGQGWSRADDTHLAAQHVE